MPRRILFAFASVAGIIVLSLLSRLTIPELSCTCRGRKTAVRSSSLLLLRTTSVVSPFVLPKIVTAGTKGCFAATQEESILVPSHSFALPPEKCKGRQTLSSIGALERQRQPGPGLFSRHSCSLSQRHTSSNRSPR